MINAWTDTEKFLVKVEERKAHVLKNHKGTIINTQNGYLIYFW